MKTDFNFKNSKYKIDATNNFNRQYKTIKKQGKDLNKLKYVIKKLANGEELERKYKNHKLIDNNVYQDCYECHISPNWLLVYKIYDELILLLFATGSHAELFKK